MTDPVLAAVATTGRYEDLVDVPPLGSAAWRAASEFAPATLAAQVQALQTGVDSGATDTSNSLADLQNQVNANNTSVNNVATDLSNSSANLQGQINTGTASINQLASDVQQQIGTSSASFLAQSLATQNAVDALTTPPEWDSVFSWAENDFVTSGGVVYVATQDVPVGIDITDTAYWLAVGTYASFVQVLSAAFINGNGNASAIATEAQARAAAITAEATARTNAINAQASAQSTALAAEATARGAAITTEQTARQNADTSLASSITTNTSAIAGNTSAIQTETTTRANADTSEANARTVLATQMRGAYTGTDLTQVTSGLFAAEVNARSSGDQALTTQMTLLQAGVGEQFDYAKIWYFTADAEGWTAGGGSTLVWAASWIYRTATNDSSYFSTPTGLAINVAEYTQFRARVRKVGAPAWRGLLGLYAPGNTGGNYQPIMLAEPAWDDAGIGVIMRDITSADVQSGQTIADEMLFIPEHNPTATDHIEIDWVAIGRPAPGASSAALSTEATARASADTAEVTARQQLSVVLTGEQDATGIALGALPSGLLVDERNARVTADASQVTATTALQARMPTGTGTLAAAADVTSEATARAAGDSANATQISGLAARMPTGTGTLAAAADVTSEATARAAGDSANATQISGLAARMPTGTGTLATAASVTSEASTRASADTANASNVTALQSSLATTNSNVTGAQNTANAAQSAASTNASAISTLNTTVSSHSNSISANTTAINSNTTAIGTKASAASLTSLSNTVSSQGTAISANTTALSSLGTTVGNNTSAITAEQSARASGDAANATAITSVQATQAQSAASSAPARMWSMTVLPDASSLSVRNGGSYALAADAAALGGAVLRCTGYVGWQHGAADQVVYDPTRIYRVRLGIRNAIAGTRVYAGLFPQHADGSYVLGSSGQCYCLAVNLSLPAGTTTLETWVTGNGGTGNNTPGTGATSGAPTQMTSGIATITPQVFVAANQTTAYGADIDFFSIEDMTASAQAQTAQAQVLTEQTARVSAVAANASAISAVQARMPGGSGTVATAASVTAVQGQVNASYTLAINGNGKATGFTAQSNGATSSFAIVADNFSVQPGSGTAGTFIDATGIKTIAGSVAMAVSTGYGTDTDKLLLYHGPASGTSISDADFAITASGKLKLGGAWSNFTSGWSSGASITYSSSPGAPAHATLSTTAGTFSTSGYAINYNAASCTVTGTGGSTVHYYLYFNDPGMAGGAKTLVASTDQNVTFSNPAYVLVGEIDVTYPTIGGGGGSGDGGNYCPAIDAYVLRDELGEPVPVRAGDVRVGDRLLLARGAWGSVSGSSRYSQQGVRVVGEDGSSLTCSISAPLQTIGGACVRAADVAGRVLKHRTLGAVRIAHVESAGTLTVQRITCENDCFWAGDTPACEFAHHNAKPARP